MQGLAFKLHGSGRGFIYRDDTQVPALASVSHTLGSIA